MNNYNRIIFSLGHLRADLSIARYIFFQCIGHLIDFVQESCERLFRRMKSIEIEISGEIKIIELLERTNELTTMLVFQVGYGKSPRLRKIHNIQARSCCFHKYYNSYYARHQIRTACQALHTMEVNLIFVLFAMFSRCIFLLIQS